MSQKKCYGVIYALINKINGEIYIGQTIHFDRRMYMYRNKHCSDQTKLFNALNKYGWEYFDVEIIDECFSVHELNEKEEFWIKYLHTVEFGYNLRYGGDCTTVSEETKKKISLAVRGEKHPNFKKKFSDEHKANISKSKKGLKPSEETLAKMSEAQKGRKHSKETKEKMSKIHSGELNPMFGKSGGLSPVFGRKHTEEDKIKMRKPKGKRKI